MTAGGMRRAGLGPLVLLLAAAAGVALTLLAAAGGSGTARAANANVNVGEGGLVYTPNHVAVTVGETVTWTWVGGFHDVVSNSAAFTSGAPVRANGQQFTHTFTTPGTFFYYCSVHAKVTDANDEGRGAGKMVGSVTVLPAQPGQTAQQATPTATRTPSGTPASTPTAVSTATATPATAAPATTPSAPKTGSGGLVAGSDAGAMAVLWLGVAVAMLAGARVVSRRGE